MRKRLCVLVVLFLTSSSTGALLADGNVNFMLGTRFMQNDQFQDLDTQPTFGVNADFAGKGWPISIATGINLSAKVETAGATDRVAGVADLSAGVKWIALRKKRVRPYVGAGLASVVLAVDTGITDDLDQSFGYYGNFGVFFRLGSRFNIGVDARILRGTDFELALPSPTRLDADSNQFSLLLGWGWPSM